MGGIEKVDIVCVCVTVGLFLTAVGFAKDFSHKCCDAS